MWTCTEGKKKIFGGFFPLCFFPFTVSHNLAPSLASLFHFISLCWLMFFNLPPLLSLPPPLDSLFPPLPSLYCTLIHPFRSSPSSISPSILSLPSVCLYHPIPFTPISHPFSWNVPLLLFFLFYLPPSYLLPSPTSPPPHSTRGHRGTAVGDRPAEITVLLF